MPNKAKLYKYSSIVLTALGYGSLHMGRAGWPYVKNSLDWIDNDFRSYIDFSFLFLYAFGMFISGPLGDKLNIRYFYTFGLASTSICYALTGMLGLFNYND